MELWAPATQVKAGSTEPKSSGHAVQGSGNGV